MSFLSVRNGIPVGVSPHLAIIGALIQAFTPASLFAAGEQGAWYDPSDLTTLYQDSAGTTPVTAVEQPVGLMRDKSGRGNHAYQSTSASRPVLSARVNLLTKTEQFDDAVWSKLQTAVIANATTAPDGTSTADKVYATATTNWHSVYQTAIPANSVVIASVYAKAAEETRVCISNQAGASGVTFDLSAVTATISGTDAAFVPSNATISSVGNGWYLCAVKLTVTTATQMSLYLRQFAVSYVGDGASGLYIWGADLRVANDGVGIPSYQRVNTSTDYDTSGFPLYLKFDGIDDGLQTNSINFTATDKVTVFAGVRKLSDAAQGTIIELSSDTFSSNGSFLLANSQAGTASYDLYSKGSLFDGVKATTFTAPITNIVTAIDSISTDVRQLRINGALSANSVTDQGTGNFGNYPLYIGRRAGTSLPFNGRLTSLIIRGAQSTDAQISAAETWVNGKTKAF